MEWPVHALNQYPTGNHPGLFLEINAKILVGLTVAGSHSFGEKYGVAVEITIGLTVAGSCISYTVLIGTLTYTVRVSTVFRKLCSECMDFFPVFCMIKRLHFCL